MKNFNMMKQIKKVLSDMMRGVTRRNDGRNDGILLQIKRKPYTTRTRYLD
jgi:hypothetical protein